MTVTTTSTYNAVRRVKTCLSTNCITRTTLSLFIIVGLLATAFMSPLGMIGTARADSVTATISLGSCGLYCPMPEAIAINPGTGNVYPAGLSSSGASSVWIINSHTNLLN
jgi:DNA-binding beta-propeller fold protein YncE